MAAFQHRSFSSPTLSLHHPHPGTRNMPTPLSPSYTPFSAPSPFSSSSSNSYPDGNSPIESHFDSLPSPVEAVNSDVAVYSAGSVSVQMFPSQGDIAASYTSDFDYGMMALASNLKKQALHQPHGNAFSKPMGPVFISPQLAHQRHSPAQPPSAQALPHHIHAQQPLMPPSLSNDVMFDVDLDDWNPPPSVVHPSTPYSSTPESRPISRSKQGSLVFDTGMGTFPANGAQQHHSHMEVQPHYFDVINPISQHNSDQNGTSLQTRRQYQQQQQQQQQSTQPFYSLPQIPRLPFTHTQPFVTVHPAEVSSLEPCPSNSPLTYPKIPSDGEPGNYMCGSEMPGPEDIKGSLDMDFGLTMPPSVIQANWNGERKMVDTELGDVDAEGEEVCPSDVEQPFNSLPDRPLIKSAPADEADDEVLFDDTDVSKLSEESSTDSDDSEFIPGSRQRRRRSQAMMSASYPSYSQLEGRSLRTRSGTRYTPYPNDYSNQRASDYLDHFDESDQSTRQKRLLPPAGGNLSAEYLNFTTLSTSASGMTRRRPRPSNTLPVPIPVPHLTKKSRGRRVPTVTSLEDLRSASSGAGRKRQTIGKGARMYLCEVEGCGKCFARGEHLKRHVRSIHTHEKPHRCPYPGCGKDFSRHDNLGQHMRVHKDYVPPQKA